jgi:hypothetical protein
MEIYEYNSSYKYSRCDKSLFVKKDNTFLCFSCIKGDCEYKKTCSLQFPNSISENFHKVSYEEKYLPKIMLRLFFHTGEYNEKDIM